MKGSDPILDTRSRGLEAWLRFAERVPTQAPVVRETPRVRLTAGRVETGAAVPFAPAVPDDALPSVESEWGQLAWSLVVQADRPRRRGVREELELEVVAG